MGGGKLEKVVGPDTVLEERGALADGHHAEPCADSRGQAPEIYFEG